MQDQWQGAVRAPNFPIGLDWLNVSKPLTLADLKGYLCLIEMWTFG